MSGRLPGFLLGAIRVLSLVVLAMLGTALLMRYAPGYFTDTREMDGQHSDVVRAALDSDRQQQESFLSLTKGLLRGWAHGDLGRSRQFDVPVSELFWSRARTTGKLVGASVVSGWLVAFALALPLSTRRTNGYEPLVSLPSAILLAAPVGALAMASMVSGIGGPVLLLTLVVAARDFKFLYRLLRQAWQSPHLLYATAMGMRHGRIVVKHVLPPLTGELLGLAMMSLVLALSSAVPVEVIFDLPGLGQLAWGAAMNRDLPLLLAVAMVMALCVGVASQLSRWGGRVESTQCA